MKEQGKFNNPGMNLPEESETNAAQTAKSPEDTERVGIQNEVYSNAVPQYGVNPPYQYGYNNTMQGVPMQGLNYQLNMPYAPYPQAQMMQGYRPNNAYPVPNTRPYSGGYSQQNGSGPGEYNYKQYTTQGGGAESTGSGPGQYSYKQSMNQYSQNNTYSGAGPGQYNYRTAQQQYGYNNTYQPQDSMPGQYPYKQSQMGANYGYYPQQQFGTYMQYNPSMQPQPVAYPQYGYGNRYNAPYAQPNNGANPNVAAPPPQTVQNLETSVIPQEIETKLSEDSKVNISENIENKIVENSDVQISEVNSIQAPSEEKASDEQIVSSNEQQGKVKKKKVIKKIIKKPIDESKTAQSKFIQDTIKAEIGELRNGEDSVVVYRSKMGKKGKSKYEDEGVYQPTLKEMIFGAKKKDTSDKEADFFEWKCPNCGTVNKDFVGTCMCGFTKREADAIAKGREPEQSLRENNPLIEDISAKSDDEFLQIQDNQPQIQIQNQPEELVASESVVVPSESQIPDDYDPEMPDVVELTEEEIQAEIDEFMRAPVQVWRPQSQRDNDNGKKVKTEIYLVGNPEEENEPDEVVSEQVKSEEDVHKVENNFEVALSENSVDEQPQKSYKDPEEPDGAVSDTEWKCSLCGTINDLTRDTCICGHKRGKKMTSYEDIIKMSRKNSVNISNVETEEPISKNSEENSDIESNEEAIRNAEEEARRKAEEEARQRAEEEARRKAEEEARRKAEEEARRKAEEEARRKAEEEARRKAEEEARRKAEEEARRKAEEEARRKAEEEARRKAEEEARRNAEEEARRKAEEEARQRAEEEARRKAEEEARRKAEEEARRKAEEEARQRAEEEARRKAEEEARRKAEEEARRKAEEEARRKAEEEARRKVEEEARQRAEEEARRKAEEEARRKAEEEARRKVEEEARQRAEEEARRKAEEEARRKAEEEARRKAEEEARRKAEEEARRRAEEEARQRAEEEARRKAEEEARQRAEEEARRKAEEEARQRAEEEARRKAEEEARQRAEEEARRKAEEEARQRAEEEARRKAEEEARQRAEEEARRKAEEEARQRAEEEARRKAEEEARQRAEEEARRKAEEEARQRAEEEARHKAEEEARRKAEEEARLKSEREAKRKADELKFIQEAQAKALEDEKRREEENKLISTPLDDEVEDDLSHLSPLQRNIELQKRRLRMEEMAWSNSHSRFPNQPQSQLDSVPEQKSDVTQNLGYTQPINKQQQSLSQPDKKQEKHSRKGKTIFGSSKKNDIHKQEREPGDNEWKCEKCGLINANYVTTCACGYRRIVRRRRAEPVNSNSVQSNEQQFDVKTSPTDAVRPLNDNASVQTQPLSPIEQNPVIEKKNEPIDQTQTVVQRTSTPIGKRIDKSDWTCFRCERVNASYVTTCACGVTKRRANKFYETGVDPYAEQEAREKEKAAERERVMETILNQRTVYTPKSFDNTVVEVETISRQSPLEQKMTKKFYDVVNKVSAKTSGTPEKEDRLEKSRQALEQDTTKRNQQQTVANEKINTSPMLQNNSVAAAQPIQPVVNPKFDREPFFDEWKCPVCGIINTDYVSTCSCGCTQRRAKRMAQQNAATQPVVNNVQSNSSEANSVNKNIEENVSVSSTANTDAGQRSENVQSRVINSVPQAREIPLSPVRAKAEQNKAKVNQQPSNQPVQQNTTASRNDREPYFDEWKCPVCGTINNDYVTACSCGCTQRRAKKLAQQNKK